MGLRFGRVFGIELLLDWSWVFIFVLLTWSLGSTFAAWHPEWAPGEAFIVAIVGAILFFVSVLLHELAHSAVALARGLKVRSITLFLFGGISNIEREPESPSVELMMAIVGPLLSILLGIILLAPVVFAVGVPTDLANPRAYVASLTALGSLLLWLGGINVSIGIFNLIPAFPLDGGRVLRSILWAATHDARTATQAASIVGQVFGWLFVLLGIAMSFGAHVPFLGTGLGSGLWLAFIGWFLRSAAAESYERVLVDEAFEGLTVASFMRTPQVGFSANDTVGGAVRNGFMRRDERAFPVRDAERFIGLLCIEDVRRVPLQDWDRTPVGSVMTPAERLTTTTTSEPLGEALVKLVRLDVGQLPVLEGPDLVGMLYRRDIARWLELHGKHVRTWHRAAAH